MRKRLLFFANRLSTKFTNLCIDAFLRTGRFFHIRFFAILMLQLRKLLRASCIFFSAHAADFFRIARLGAGRFLRLRHIRMSDRRNFFRLFFFATAAASCHLSCRLAGRQLCCRPCAKLMSKCRNALCLRETLTILAKDTLLIFTASLLFSCCFTGCLFCHMPFAHLMSCHRNSRSAIILFFFTSAANLRLDSFLRIGGFLDEGCLPLMAKCRNFLIAAFFRLTANLTFRYAVAGFRTGRILLHFFVSMRMFFCLIFALRCN